MSANVSALNLAVSGSTAISGSVSLSSPLISGSTASYQGVSTTDLSTTGSVTHNALPICNVLPMLNGELTNKAYVDTKNSIQDGRITAEETKTQNITYSVPNSRTTITGSSTVSGLMTFTVNPRCSTVPVALTELSNKQYVDNNFTIASNSISVTNNNLTTTNNNVTALTNRVNTTESKLTNTSFNGANGTTSVAGVLSLTGITSTLASSVMPKSYIDAQDLIATNAITALQTENGTQNSQILGLQEKTSAIVYSNPVSGQLTEISSSVSVLPFNNTTSLKSFSLSCNNILCTTQATFGGVGANRGITTSQLQVGGFGNAFQTVYVGSVTSVVGSSNLVTFATALTGNFPKIFLQAVNGTVTLTNKTLAGFTFSATSVVNVDYWVVQLV
jgi:hypothetical protein